ncbi:unnamed protein product [marine sediment metagenome]|uniref:Uncharacterized protein n=1 Tax=marine sediment metagenome TaxID=412755 RepID=X1BQS0_9ZZZZ
MNARTYLKGEGFTSMKDAISVYEHALKNIEALKKKTEKKDSKNSVLGILGETDDETEEENFEEEDFGEEIEVDAKENIEEEIED